MVKGITHILKSNTAVQTLVGRNKEDNKYKVYPGVCAVPEQYPYQVVRQTGRTVVGECKGSQGSLYDYTYDVFSFHRNYEDCEDLDRAGVDALQDQEGTFNGVVFSEPIRHLNSMDGDYVGEHQLHVRISSFQGTVQE